MTFVSYIINILDLCEPSFKWLLLFLQWEIQLIKIILVIPINSSICYTINSMHHILKASRSSYIFRMDLCFIINWTLIYNIKNDHQKCKLFPHLLTYWHTQLLSYHLLYTKWWIHTLLPDILITQYRWILPFLSIFKSILLRNPGLHFITRNLIFNCLIIETKIKSKIGMNIKCIIL